MVVLSPMTSWTVYVPADPGAGVPEIVPLVARLRPDGSGAEPPLTMKSYGAVPPEPLRVQFYAAVSQPTGRTSGPMYQFVAHSVILLYFCAGATRTQINR